jgi:hypothetical protein
VNITATIAAVKFSESVPSSGTRRKVPKHYQCFAFKFGRA